ACEGQILEMKCPVDYVISFISAFYGRNDLDICAANDTAAHNVTNCSAGNPLQSLEAKCAGKSFCEFNTTSENIGEDPCPGIQKVLSVEFYCSGNVEYLLTGTQCEGKSIYLECQENEGVEIKEAFYGRDPNDQNTCRSSDVEWLPTNCSSNTALDTLKQLCASKRLCDIYVHPSLLGDPCVETSKYLNVTFVCFREYHPICEAQTTFMSCQANQGLRIYEAFFGRKDNTTCPHPAIQSDDCPSHWSVTPNVQHICQGRPYCYMSAQIEVFTDPCPGNFKYLEVKYECQGNVDKNVNFNTYLTLQNVRIRMVMMTVTCGWSKENAS
ncbi:hypothetical protein CAPTEDRAFT_102020, partial [Capitella teleta]